MNPKLFRRFRRAAHRSCDHRQPGSRLLALRPPPGSSVQPRRLATDSRRRAQRWRRLRAHAALLLARAALLGDRRGRADCRADPGLHCVRLGALSDLDRAGCDLHRRGARFFIPGSQHPPRRSIGRRGRARACRKAGVDSDAGFHLAGAALRPGRIRGHHREHVRGQDRRACGRPVQSGRRSGCGERPLPLALDRDGVDPAKIQSAAVRAHAAFRPSHAVCRLPRDQAQHAVDPGTEDLGRADHDVLLRRGADPGLAVASAARLPRRLRALHGARDRRAWRVFRQVRDRAARVQGLERPQAHRRAVSVSVRDHRVRRVLRVSRAGLFGHHLEADRPRRAIAIPSAMAECCSKASWR